MPTDPRRYRTAVAAILVVAAVARIGATLAAGGVWRDEANDIFLVREAASFGTLLDDLREEGSPPLRFALDYAIQQLAPGDLRGAQSVAVALGVLAVGLVMWIGARAFDPVTGLVAGALAAVSPYLIRYSIELRGYALYQVVAAGYALALLALVRDRGPWVVVASGVAGGALALTHYYGILLVAVGSVYGAWRARRDGVAIAPIATSAAIAALLFAPWLPTFATQAFGTLRPWSVPNDRGADLLAVLGLPLGTASVWLVAIGLAAGALARWRVRSDGWDLLVVGSLGAGIVAWVVQFVAVRARLEPPYLVGYTVWLLPAVGHGYVRLGGAIARARWRWAGRAVLSAATVVLGASLIADTRERLGPRSAAPHVAALVARRADADDLIVFVPAPIASSFNFYYARAQRQWAPPFRSRITHVPWAALSGAVTDRGLLAQMTRDLRRHLQAGRRVWLVASGLPSLDETTWPEGVLSETAYARGIERTARSLLEILRREAVRVPLDPLPSGSFFEPMEVALFAPVDRGRAWLGDAG